MFTYDIVDTRTGVKQLQVFPVSGSGTRLLNGPGSGGSHTFQLGASSGLSWAQWDALTVPWARTLVVSWKGVAKYSGLISRRTRDPAARQMTLSHVDIRALLATRYIFGGGQYRPGLQGTTPGDLTLANMELYSIAAQVILSAMTGPGGIYGLPIALAATVAGGQNRPYHNENFINAEAGLQEIQSADGGPDIDLAPRWKSDGTHEWYQCYGTPAQPRIVGSQVDLLASADKSTAFDITVTEDAVNQMTGVFAVGNGNGKDMLVEGSGLADMGLATIPARDTTEQFKEVADSVQLFGHAKAEMFARRFPTQQWSLSIMADGSPGLADIELGTAVSLYFKNEDWISDGWVRLRCLQYSFDMSGVVKLELQPIGG